MKQRLPDTVLALFVPDTENLRAAAAGRTGLTFRVRGR